MPVDDDLSVSLPEPPPPNPARREAAIGAALRRFDGREDEPAAAARPREAGPPWWTRLRQPQFGVAVSVAVLAVIGIPAALMVIRDRPPAVSVAPTISEAPRQSAAPEVRRAPPPAAPVAEAPATPPASPAPPARAQMSDKLEAQQNMDARAEEAPAPAFAPAPPPPPPPPAAQAPVAGAVTQELVSNVVVTGTRALSRERAAKKVSKSADTASAEPANADEANNSAYAAFLTRLQAAVRTNDRASLIKLVGFPLRVNSNGRSRFYPNARSVERDFDRIFTPRVRQSILAQRPDQLFIRDQGAMIGDGEVWFDHSCLNSGCTALGPVRITAVNP